tara:strand:+ start:493 stop:696 length:204 start_codon:yes stop_codon:yes gene_type:complete
MWPTIYTIGIIWIAIGGLLAFTIGCKDKKAYEVELEVCSDCGFEFQKEVSMELYEGQYVCFDCFINW